MLKTLTLTLLAVACCAADTTPKPLAEDIFDKAVEANASEAIKAYSDYQTKLDAANKKVLKALEAAKADLNDVKKGKWSLTERAEAIKAIDEKIAAIKKDGVGEAVVGKVVARSSGANEPKPKVGKPDPNAPIIGKWEYIKNPNVKNARRDYEFFKDGTGMADGWIGIKWELKDGREYNLIYPELAKNRTFIVNENGTEAQGVWTAGDTDTVTFVRIDPKKPMKK